jgi:hypothetical protein
MFEYMKFRLDETNAADYFDFLVSVRQRSPRRTWNLVVESPDGEFAGWAGLDARSDDGEAEFGWYLASEHWGRGYATEATRLLIDFACGTLELCRLFANGRSRERCLPAGRKERAPLRRPRRRRANVAGPASARAVRVVVRSHLAPSGAPDRRPPVPLNNSKAHAGRPAGPSPTSAPSSTRCIQRGYTAPSRARRSRPRRRACLRSCSTVTTIVSRTPTARAGRSACRGRCCRVASLAMDGCSA